MLWIISSSSKTHFPTMSLSLPESPPTSLCKFRSVNFQAIIFRLLPEPHTFFSPGSIHQSQALYSQCALHLCLTGWWSHPKCASSLAAPGREAQRTESFTTTSFGRRRQSSRCCWRIKLFIFFGRKVTGKLLRTRTLTHTCAQNNSTTLLPERVLQPNLHEEQPAPNYSDSSKSGCVLLRIKSAGTKYKTLHELQMNFSSSTHFAPHRKGIQHPVQWGRRKKLHEQCKLSTVREECT